jgi:hypothetical protein
LRLCGFARDFFKHERGEFMKIESGQEGYTMLTKTVERVFLIKTIVGVVLMILGCIAAFLILLLIFNIITSPDEIALVKKISQIATEGIEVEAVGQSVKIPPVVSKYGNMVLSYLITLILLGIIAGLTKAFLYTGASLVKSDIKPLLEKLGEVLGKLWGSEQKEPEART